MMNAAFGCQIILWGTIAEIPSRDADFGSNRYDPYLRADSPWKGLHHTRISDLEKELYPVCDVISLHVPLLDSTRGMVGLKQFKTMKSTVLILNTSRGGIIDEDEWVCLTRSLDSQY
jgi:phosphoglycerate dehydrogenase-like enzyme